MKGLIAGGIAISAGLLCGMGAMAQSAPAAGGMTFFVTSAGSGKGADLGGLDGADRICQTLAQAAGAGAKTWRAYLSTQAQGGTAAVNAKDRIGRGPWQNAKGDVIAKDVAELHGTNNLTKQTALSEKGEMVKGRGDTPNTHDMSGTDGAAMLGHHDRTGTDEQPPAKSWNSSHASRGGCSQDALKGTGGAGLFFCFAAN
jgi:hypothetical protein